MLNMKKNYVFPIIIFILLLLVGISCSDDFSEDDERYRLIGPVRVDLTQVPFAKLSDYRFFIGALNEMKPAQGVLPYKPASELFSDYAQKSRFVWMPAGTKATYNGDDNVLEFPLGTVLIKTFYFDQVAPFNSRKIIETRLLIKKSEATPNSSGWQAYDYIWDEKQKNAYLDTDGNGLFVPVTFTQNGQQRTVDYKIPAQTECLTCHKLNPTQSENGELTVPIGPKPQNLNYSYNYAGGSMNQLQKWISVGYLQNNLPANIVSTVDYKDPTQPLELRAKSYLDMNCAHCHRVGGHCDYVEAKFNFSNSDLYQMGVCMPPLFSVDDGPYIINRGKSNKSELVVRMSSVNQAVMMPIIGRTVVHDEGVALIKQWIDALPGSCE
jgi:uncharacterized repeat protein (TIGR03806 family)